MSKEEKQKRKDNIMIVLGLLILIGMISGITYSFFNYTRTGSNNTLKVGRIYFNTTENRTISLSNVFPIKEDTLINNENYSQLEVQITGDTSYKEGIEYKVSLEDVYVTVGTSSNLKRVPVRLMIEPHDLGIPFEINNEDALLSGDASNLYWNNRGKSVSVIGLRNYNGLQNNSLVNLESDNQSIIVGYIAKDRTGINGNFTIKAFFPDDLIAISDTYSGEESDNMGTTTEWVDGRMVLTTSEWNSLQNNPISFKVKVEANEGIWVEDINGNSNHVTLYIKGRKYETIVYNNSSSYTIEVDNDGNLENNINVYNNMNNLVGTGVLKQKTDSDNWYYEITMNEGVSSNIELNDGVNTHIVGLSIGNNRYEGRIIGNSNSVNIYVADGPILTETMDLYDSNDNIVGSVISNYSSDNGYLDMILSRNYQLTFHSMISTNMEVKITNDVRHIDLNIDNYYQSFIVPKNSNSFNSKFMINNIQPETKFTDGNGNIIATVSKTEDYYTVILNNNLPNDVTLIKESEIEG